MKKYKVIVTPDAEHDLKAYLKYLRDIKKNPQAVKNVLNDFRDTIKLLRDVAGSLAEPESEKLVTRSLRRINFKRHNYFMLYYIDSSDVVECVKVFL